MIQERSHAYALKSSIWLLDPRPDLPNIVHIVEKGFELSEASHAPVMLELRIRACHVTGSFAAKDNRKPAISELHRTTPAPHQLRPALASAGHLHAGEAEGRAAHAGGARIHPPREAERILRRRPEGYRHHRAGRPLSTARCARWSGSALPTCSANAACRCCASTSPIRWCRKKSARFCADKKPVLIVEEGFPEYIEQMIDDRFAPRRHPDPPLRQGRAAAGRRIYPGRAAQRARAIPQRGTAGTARSRDRQRQGSQDRSRICPQSQQSLRDHAAAPADLLHRLPGAPGLLRAQADAGARPATGTSRADIGCHCFGAVRAVQHGQFRARLRHVARERRRRRPEPAEAPDRDHGRRRLLA